MKNKKIRIVIGFVLLVIFVTFLYKKIMFYEVKSKFLSKIYELNRNGNYHLIYKSLNDGSTTEILAKDGKSIEMTSYKSEDGLTKIIQVEDMNGHIFIDENEKTYIKSTHEINNYKSDSLGYQFPRMLLFQDTLFSKDLKINKIENGEYEGRKCFIMEVLIEDSKIKRIIYIDSETYIPLKSKTISYLHSPTETVEDEIIFQEISVGTVEELPEINLDEYEEKLYCE